VGRFENVDWERLLKVLRLTAERAVRDAPPTFDCGVSAEDLVGETLNEFWASENGLGWKREKGKLEAFLARVLQNKAITHLRRQKFVAGSMDDPDSRYSALAAPEDSRVECAFAWKALERLVHGHKDLENLVAAAQLRPGGPNVNQEIAELMGKTPSQVAKLKIKLMTVPGVKELLYGKRELAQRTRR